MAAEGDGDPAWVEQVCEFRLDGDGELYVAVGNLTLELIDELKEVVAKQMSAS